MKMYNYGIVDVAIDVMKQYKQTFITNIDQFEEKINTLAPSMIEECYLLIKALRSGLFEMVLLGKELETKMLVSYCMEKEDVDREDAVFTIGILKQILNNVELQMSIINLKELIDYALEHEIFIQIKMAAVVYYDGVGVTQDYEEAYRLFYYLFEHGDYEVLSYLGYMLEHGLGVEEDIIQAIDYYERGALNQNDLCLYYLGKCYYEGKGYTQDIDMAKAYLKQSHIVQSYKLLSEIYENQGMIGKAFQYAIKAGYEYDPDYLYKVGMAYFDGIGTNRDIEESIKYFVYASYLNQKDSYCQLGYMMIKGIGLTMDIDKGLRYIEKSVSLESAHGNLMLAKFYENGLYVEKDIHKSIYYYQKAQEVNDREI